MNKIVYLDGQRLQLGPEQFVQSGGEGQIFVRNETAIKLYFDPSDARIAKLRAMLRHDLVARAPAGVLAPAALVADEGGKPIGYAMHRLPDRAQPLSALANSALSAGMGWTLPQTVRLLQRVHVGLVAMHRLGLIVGDLSDSNIFFTASGRREEVFWIDVDSYQYRGYPCPVAMLGFLDPKLFGVREFAAQPVFTTESDWYAYTVLVAKCVLQVHPFGGTHHHLKSLQARAKAGKSVLAHDVIYPKSARPPSVLSAPLRQHIEDVLTHGERKLFPQALLAKYAGSLTICPRCGSSGPHARAVCPTCAATARAPATATALPNAVGRELLRVQGTIHGVFVESSGRIAVIVRRGRDYDFLRAGPGDLCDRFHLCRGEAGLVFAYSDGTLVIGARGRSQLLIVDVRGADPKRVNVLTTQLVSGMPQFAASSTYVYRLANGYVLRGRPHPTGFVEEIVAQANRRQTMLWGAADLSKVAGCYRILDTYKYFLLDDKRGQKELDLVAGPSVGERRNLVAYPARTHVAFLWQARAAGSLHTHLHLLTGEGRLLLDAAYEADTPPHDRTLGRALIGTSLFAPTDSGLLAVRPEGNLSMDIAVPWLSASSNLKAHPEGLVVQNANAIALLRHAELDAAARQSPQSA